MLNYSLHHQLYHHMHNYTDIAFKIPSRLRGLICIHALDNTCLSLLAANPLCLCFLLPPLCSHLVPSLSHPLLCVSFHLFWKNTYWAIHFHSFSFPFSSTWYPIKLSEGRVQKWIEEINRKMSVTVPLVWNLRKSLFLLQPFLFHSVSFLSYTWVEFLLGNIETIGQMGALPDGCGHAIQAVYLDFKMGSPDIHRFFFFGPILGPASCPVFICYWNMFGHFTAPESLLPVMWYTHILLVSLGTSWFSQ